MKRNTKDKEQKKEKKEEEKKGEKKKGANQLLRNCFLCRVNRKSGGKYLSILFRARESRIVQSVACAKCLPS